uniref:Protein kinase domain-containing protein n=1 Tax=Oryza meridionalis TaxID=40149 RepID=A0A0E0DD27_9ORYZ
MWFEESMNTSGIYNQTPCSYTVLMEASNFSFSTTYLTSLFEFNKTYGGQAPVVLDWTIQTANACKEAEFFLHGYLGKGIMILMNVNMERVTLAMEIATINLAVSIVCVMLVVVEIRQFKEDAGKTSYHRKHDWQLALLRQTDEFFQQHGGQILLEMMKADGNDGFTLYKREEIETATKNFNKAHVTGEGGQGTVYKAVIDGVTIAIKKCKEIDESRKMEFMQELVILCRVSHPNIVKLLGCCLQFEAPMLVYEFIQNKTLQELLDLQRNALSHLHSLPHPILHGDVKIANILLANGLVAKVSDFGCSTIDERTQAVPKGRPGYIDLDYLVEYQLTTKNDVYSFGAILLELLTGRRPLSKERKSLTLMFQEARANGALIELLDSDIVDETSMRVINRAADH